MRISDWSSDVCSSDLFRGSRGLRGAEEQYRQGPRGTSTRERYPHHAIRHTTLAGPPSSTAQPFFPFRSSTQRPWSRSPPERVAPGSAFTPLTELPRWSRALLASPRADPTTPLTPHPPSPHTR